MKSSRRHESLIPLSREHHFALMFCLRLNRGLAAQPQNLSWLEEKRDHAIQFFESELAIHFRAEEEILFPAMQSLEGAAEVIKGLLVEHRRLGELIVQLRRIETKLLAGVLSEFADQLEAHIRKEERTLFDLYEQQAPPDLARSVGKAILDRIGSALRPKHPELLR